MKLLAASILILVFLDGYQSAPLVNYDGAGGFHRARHSSNRWGIHTGVGVNLGFEAGRNRDGLFEVKSHNNVGLDVGGYNDDDSSEYYIPTGFDYVYYPYGSPYVGYVPYYPNEENLYLV